MTTRFFWVPDFVHALHMRFGVQDPCRASGLRKGCGGRWARILHALGRMLEKQRRLREAEEAYASALGAPSGKKVRACNCIYGIMRHF